MPPPSFSLWLSLSAGLQTELPSVLQISMKTTYKDLYGLILAASVCWSCYLLLHFLGLV